MAKSTQAKINASNRYKYKAYDTLQVAIKKEYRINDLVDYAACKTNKSKAQYVLDALKKQLECDGISIDILPPKDVSFTREKVGVKRTLKEYMVYETLITDKRVTFWVETLIITTDLEKAREKLSAAINKTKGDEYATPYIRGWKFEAYTKKDAISMCKEMINDVKYDMDDDGEVIEVFNHVREPDYIEGLE